MAVVEQHRPVGNRAGRKIPTGPRGLPFLGNMFEFRGDFLNFSIRVARDFGEVAAFRVANRTFYQVSHPDGVKRVLQDNHRNYGRDTAGFILLKPALGNGLLVADGDFWLRQRRLMQPSFHRRQIAAFGTMMVDACLEMLASWERPAGRGEVVNIAAEMMRVTLVIVARALFGVDISAEVKTIGRATELFSEDFMVRFSVPFYPPHWVPTPLNRRFLALLREIDRIVYGIIAERRRSGAERDDLLSMLMGARDEESGAVMDDRQLRDEVFTLLAAGHETTAIAMTWAFYLLSLHPTVRQQLHQEVDEVLGGRPPTVDDLPNLSFTRMVVEETLRLYPPAYFITRNVIADDEICGYHIPAGAIVGVSPYVTHRLPSLWDNPEGFDPERFDPARTAERPKYAYFPFGGGPHLCIGAGFAMVEAQLLLATIAQRYRLDLVPGQSVAPVPLVTLRPRRGVFMTLNTRR